MKVKVTYLSSLEGQPEVKRKQVYKKKIIKM